MSLEDKENYTKDKVLALLDETHEVLREINWKSWKKTKKDIDHAHLLEELADIRYTPSSPPDITKNPHSNKVYSLKCTRFFVIFSLKI